MEAQQYATRPLKKSKGTKMQKQMAMKTQLPKPLGCSKSSPKWEIHSNSILPQATRKTQINNLNLIPKATRERKISKTQSQQERNYNETQFFKNSKNQ